MASECCPPNVSTLNRNESRFIVRVTCQQVSGVRAEGDASKKENSVRSRLTAFTGPRRAAGQQGPYVETALMTSSVDQTRQGRWVEHA